MTKKLSKSNEALLLAIKKGYYVNKEGSLYTPNKVIITGYTNRKGYRVLTVKFKMEDAKVAIHRLVAYQKYGEEIFNKGIMVRHLNGIKEDNSDSNIAIGTNSDNQMDISSHKRVSRAIKGANRKRRFTDSEVEIIRLKHKNGKSYSQLMEEYNISSKGTISYLINKKYVTTKTGK